MLLNQVRRPVRRGFSLAELLVVIGVIALLAAIIIPRLADVYERSRSGVQAYSLTDASRTIENFFGVNKKYPDGWDTLTVDGGTLYTKLSPGLGGTRTFLTTGTLTPDQVTSLNLAGIGHVFLHDATTSAYSDSGTDRRHFGTGSGHDGTANINTVAVVNKAAGTDGLSLLINDFGLNPNKSASDTTMPIITGNTFVAFGFGPRCNVVTNMSQSAPLFEAADPTKYYARGIAVFQVPNTGTTRAKFVGMIGPDGRTSRTSLGDYQSGQVAH